MALSKAQQINLISAAALLPHYAGVLSDFECETVAEVGFRWLRHGCDAIITAAEWIVIEDALAGMRASARLPALRRVAA